MDIVQILNLMVKRNISDVHFKANSKPLIRFNGELFFSEFEEFTPQVISDIAFTLMTPEQKKYFEEENELDFSYAIDKVSRFRVNVYKQRGTIALSLRVVPLKVRTFAELNLPEKVLETLASETRGLVLVAGITGAGKTTTLNAMLDYINNNMSYNIITIEDPIEYFHKDIKSSISQREVGVDTKSFEVALKHILRQDPDVIALGEMRDHKEISAAITAAETGHLVLSTLHTMDSLHTIDRIVDSYPPHQQNSVRIHVASIVKGVIAQRLIPSIDGREYIPVTEIMINTNACKKAIIENNKDNLYKLIEQGEYYGMHSFDQAIYALYKEGRISAEQAMSNATNTDNLALKMKGFE
jgi:twitching motility protein PilT